MEILRYCCHSIKLDQIGEKIMSMKKIDFPLSPNFSRVCQECNHEGIESNGNLICPSCHTEIITRWNFKGIGFAERGYVYVELPIQNTFSGIINDFVFSFTLWHWEFNISYDEFIQTNVRDEKRSSMFILNHNGYHFSPNFHISKIPQNVSFNHNNLLWEPSNDSINCFFNELINLINIIDDQNAIEREFSNWLNQKEYEKRKYRGTQDDEFNNLILFILI